MVAVLRTHGLRFVILTDDHEPAHVHVYGDGEARIAIRGADGRPLLLDSVAMKANTRRRAMDIVLEHQDELMARWNEIHGERQ